MKAMMYRRYGGPERLQLEHVEVPEPSAGQARIRVHAAGLNAADWRIMQANPWLVRLAMGLRRPRFGVPGSDVAGIVDEVGFGCERLAVGDSVIARVDRGGCAEYVVVKEAFVAAAPTTCDAVHAAAVGMAGCTALQALRDVGNYAPGMRVLVNGAAGGIGHWVVQLAVANDCQVTGVCSTTNVEFVRELGAQSVIDYRHEDFTATEERFDLIIDVVGNVPSRDMASLLVPGGTYVDVGGIAGNGRILGPAAHQFRTALTSPFVRGKRLRMITEQRRHEDLAQLAQLIDDGKVATHVSRTWPLAETPEAMAHIATGHARGKVVVTIA